MLSAGDRAPAFDLPDTLGGRRTLAAGIASGPLVLAFSALDCQTCDLAYLFWDQIHERYAERGCELWAISLDSPEDAADFVERSGVEFPMLVDEGLRVVRSYGPSATPAVFLVSADGTVTASHQGFERAALNDISAALADHTGLPPVEIPEGAAPTLRPGCTIHGL